MDELMIIAALITSSEEICEERQAMRQLRSSSDPFRLPEAKFKKLYRLPPHCALDLIHLLDGEELRSGSIPAHIKVLSTLHFLAQGSYQAGVGQDNLVALSQPSVSRCLEVVTRLILVKITPTSITFSTTEAGKEKVKEEFMQLYGMPHCLGAVDGSHIGIAAPPLNHPTAPGNIFYNRKGFYSINCQVVCDARGRITSVNPNFPGSTHDAAVWRASQLYRYLEGQWVQGHRTQWLLGDKGYPLLPWLMTPHPDPSTEPERKYNLCHARARNSIERTFGRLKNKFRCLMRHRVLHYAPEKAAHIIICCCTLYNAFMDALTDEEEDFDEDVEDGDVIQQDYLQEARMVQRDLIYTYFRYNRFLLSLIQN